MIERKSKTCLKSFMYLVTMKLWYRYQHPYHLQLLHMPPGILQHLLLLPHHFNLPWILCVNLPITRFNFYTNHRGNNQLPFNRVLSATHLVTALCVLVSCSVWYNCVCHFVLSHLGCSRWNLNIRLCAGVCGQMGGIISTGVGFWIFYVSKIQSRYFSSSKSTCNSRIRFGYISTIVNSSVCVAVYCVSIFLNNSHLRSTRWCLWLLSAASCSG